MSDKSTGWFILISLMSLLLVGYLLAWRSNHLAVSKGASGVIAVVSGLAATVGIAGYAIPALGDLRSPADSFAGAVIANLIIWGICLGAGAMAVRFAASALRKHSHN